MKTLYFSYLLSLVAVRVSVKHQSSRLSIKSTKTMALPSSHCSVATLKVGIPLKNTDQYAALHPPCASFADQGCDSYAAIYLDGDPNDGAFDSGDQGYGMLHEETLQYVNSLATSYAFEDQFSYSTSARDEILTFLWYTMRYLRMARLEHPEAYTLLSESSCWRDLILQTCGRAWLYLEMTSGSSTLGINDDFLMTLVMEPELLSEIQRLRDIEGCE